MPPKTPKQTACALLSRRSLTCDELRGNLLKKGFKESEIDELMAELVEDNYIDEQAIVEDHVKRSRDFRLAGRRLIRYELKRRGIDEKLIDDVLNRDYPQDIEYDIAHAFAARKVKTFGAIEPIKKKRRLAGALSRRGFAGEIIGRIIENFEDS